MGKLGKRRLNDKNVKKVDNKTTKSTNDWILDGAEYFDANFDIEW